MTESPEREPIPPWPKEKRDLAIEFARLKYQAQLTSAYERSKAVFDFALLGLRSIVIVNGGAIVGLLTFVGNFNRAADSAGVWAAFVCFAVGLFAALAAILASYSAQSWFYWCEELGPEINARETFEVDASDIRKRASDFLDRGMRRQRVAMASGLLSALLFLAGAILSLSGLL